MVLERQMIDRITLIIAAVLLALFVGEPTGADDAGDLKAAAERRLAAERAQRRVDFERLQAEHENALRAQRLRQGLIVDEPEEEFVDEDYGDLLPSERPIAQMALASFDNSLFGSQGSRENLVRKMEKILQSRVE